MMRIYTVVDVMCGVAVEAKSFCRRESAQKYLRKLRRGRNLDEDDVQLFEDNLQTVGENRPTILRSVSRRLRRRPDARD
jgi:hypothetical protein